jgi:outer membrane protein assembly factor BamB
MNATPAPSPLPMGVQEWRFDAAAPIAGPIAVGTDGRSAIVTAGRRLVVLDSNGNETFAHPAGGESAQISAGGTVYAEGPSGGLFAYNPDGSARWDASLAAGPGPIAIGADGTIYYADSNQLSAVSSSGDVQWNAAIPGVTQVIAQDDTVVAATGGGITAFSSDGIVAWTYAPDGGIAGGIAADSAAVYAASTDGAIHALSLSDGTELWHDPVTNPIGGVAVSASGTVFVSADRVYAFTADGTSLWTSQPMALSSVPPVASADTVFVVVGGNHIASFDEKGDLNWVAGNFANIVSIDLSPSGLLFVGQSNGTLSVLKIAAR